MVLKLSKVEAQEVHKALSAAYLQVLGDLSRRDGCAPDSSVELCQRRWRLDTLLCQLEPAARWAGARARSGGCAAQGFAAVSRSNFQRG